jgi:sigma-B regulation protein RsbU (phosphoserine phosphatase)
MNIAPSRRVILGVAMSLAASALAVFVWGGGWSDLGGALVAALVYGLPLLAIEAATEKTALRWADRSRFPIDWIVYAGIKVALGLVVAGIGTALMLLLGIVSRWQQLYIANRMVVVVWVIASCLVRLYNMTRRRLEDRNLQLEARVESEARVLRLHEQDFELAREIQQGLMPKELPLISGCQLAATCQPARSVGGDYYDAIRIGDDTVALAIGDVSGKGMAAALLMSNLQAIVRAFAPAGVTPRELCAKANQLIASNVAAGKYITFFYAVADVGKMRLDYCCAGHNPPMLQRSDGRVEMLAEGGPVLGVFAGASYVGGSVELRAGDCLVLSTDGITEAMNAADEEFGDERLMELLGQGVGRGAEDCRARVMTAVTQFSNGNFHDDATVMVMTVN